MDDLSSRSDENSENALLKKMRSYRVEGGPGAQAAIAALADGAWTDEHEQGRLFAEKKLSPRKVEAKEFSCQTKTAMHYNGMLPIRWTLWLRTSNSEIDATCEAACIEAQGRGHHLLTCKGNRASWRRMISGATCRAMGFS